MNKVELLDEILGVRFKIHNEEINLHETNLLLKHIINKVIDSDFKKLNTGSYSFDRKSSPSKLAYALARRKDNIKKDKIIFDLWKLLDEIDTASDMFKEDYESLSKYVYKKQRKRFDIIDINSVETLYNMFNKEEIWS